MYILALAIMLFAIGHIQLNLQQLLELQQLISLQLYSAIPGIPHSK